jgi:sialic acid synthase SpsE
MRRTKIGKTIVGDGYPTYVILEIARTYKDLREAKEMIEIAAHHGANAIKIQSILAEELMIKNSHTREYVGMLENLERSSEEHMFFKNECGKAGIDFLSTPEGPSMANLLEKIDIPAYKVSSLNLVYHDLLKMLAQTGKPIIVSTGMGENEEIDKTVNDLQSEPSDLILLHCSSTYPTDPKNSNLKNIIYFRDRYPNVIGYSDHTIGTLAPVVAISLGAAIIEKHFTLDRAQTGVDHHVGADPAMLERMMKDIRTTEQMLGQYKRNLCVEERSIRTSKRRKIVLAKDVNNNCEIKKQDLVCLQTKSEQGIDIKHIEFITGKLAGQHLPAGTILEWEHLL